MFVTCIFSKIHLQNIFCITQNSSKHIYNFQNKSSKCFFHYIHFLKISISGLENNCIAFLLYFGKQNLFSIWKTYFCQGVSVISHAATASTVTTLISHHLHKITLTCILIICTCRSPIMPPIKSCSTQLHIVWSTVHLPELAWLMLYLLTCLYPQISSTPAIPVLFSSSMIPIHLQRTQQQSSQIRTNEQPFVYQLSHSTNWSIKLTLYSLTTCLLPWYVTISLSYAIYNIYLAFISSIFWSEKNTVLPHESKPKYYYEAHYVRSIIKKCC